MSNLTVLQVKAMKESGGYSDGGGLLLVVRESGAKSWLWRGQSDGKRRDIGLGTYPAGAYRRRARRRRRPANSSRPAKTRWH